MTKETLVNVTTPDGVKTGVTVTDQAGDFIQVALDQPEGYPRPVVLCAISQVAAV